MIARRLLPALLALLALPAFAAARGDAASARAATLERFDAALRADIPALDRLLADDLDYCTPRGNCLTKPQYLELVKGGQIKYLSSDPTVDRVKLYADTSTVTGRATVTLVRDGQQETIHISWAGVQVWRDARWQLTTWTATLLADSAKTP